MLPNSVDMMLGLIDVGPLPKLWQNILKQTKIFKLDNSGAGAAVRTHYDFRKLISSPLLGNMFKQAG